MRRSWVLLFAFLILAGAAMFDEARANRAVRFFESLKHTKGRFYGQPFELLPWQQQIVRDVYGTVNEAGLRTIKTVYLEIPKKNGKSELAAGAGLFHTFADGERNGEVYGCAADRSQASIVFDVAVDMIDQLPALKKRTKMRLSQKEITDKVSGTVYKVVSAESYCIHPDTWLDLENGGRKRAKDIVPGDIVIGWNGRALAAGVVAHTAIQPESPIYRIRTVRGREVLVTGEHPFLMMVHGRRPQDQTHKYKWVEAKNLSVGDRIRIALGWPSEIKPGNIEEAWALGAWAGDGECGRFRFISIDPEIVERMRRFFESIGSTLKSNHSTRQFENEKLWQYPIEHQVKGNGKRTKSPGREWIRSRFGQAARSSTKNIPEIIWHGGPSVWAAFLAGYLDTDGCIPALTPCVRWWSSSHEMLISCQTLLARLGINGTIIKNRLTVSGRAQLKHLYELLAPHMALTRKAQQLLAWAEHPYALNFNAHDTDRIISIEQEEKQITISIEVDGIDTHVTNGIITHNTKHGLNASAVIFDELHAQPNRDLWDVMTFGTGDARTQPIWWVITTAGDDPDRVSIGWEQHEYAMKVLSGDIVDPTWYAVVYGYDGDDIYNEENWAFANPSLGHTIMLDSVREAAARAKNNPADERLFRWLRLNQWITTKLTTWLPLELFDATNGDWTRADLLGLDCYLGLDLSSTTDLTALTVVFPPQGAQLDWRVFWDCWIPAENMKERVERDHVPYDLWAREGWITPTEGDVVDYTKIRERILEIGKFHNVKEVCSDRAFATMLLQELEQEGLTCVDIPQTFLSLTNPLSETERLLREGKISHEPNPVARWNFGNASIAKNGNAQIKLVKEHKGKSVVRTRRIDLVSSWIDAMARAVTYKGSIDLSAAILDPDWGM